MCRFNSCLFIATQCFYFQFIFSVLCSPLLALSLREKCPNTELFLVRIFLHSDQIRKDMEHISATSPNVRKYGPEITPYLDTFHAVLHSKIIFIHSKILVLHPIADLLCNNDVFIQYLVNFLLIHSIIRTFIIQFYFILSCILNIHSIIWLSKISTISLKTLTFI